MGEDVDAVTHGLVADMILLFSTDPLESIDSFSMQRQKVLLQISLTSPNLAVSCMRKRRVAHHRGARVTKSGMRGHIKSGGTSSPRSSVWVLTISDEALDRCDLRCEPKPPVTIQAR